MRFDISHKWIDNQTDMVIYITNIQLIKNEKKM